MTPATPVTADRPSSARPESPRAPRGLSFLRGAVACHTASVVVQPVLAGLYLTGSPNALGFHSLNANILSLLVLVQGVAAALYAWRGRGRWWPFAATVAMFFVEGVQHGLGYARDLDLHVPVGVLVVVCQLLVTVGVFGRGVRRGRPRRNRPRTS